MSQTARATPTKFRPRPRLGLLRERVAPASEATLRADLLEVLDRLEEQERAVLHLLYWHDLSVRRVGAGLGVDHKTVARIHARGIAKLRRIWGVAEKLAA